MLEQLFHKWNQGESVFLPCAVIDGLKIHDPDRNNAHPVGSAKREFQNVLFFMRDDERRRRAGEFRNLSAHILNGRRPAVDLSGIPLK